MYLVMWRENSEKNDEPICIYMEKDEMMEDMFPMGTDEYGRCQETLQKTKDGEYVGYYFIEIDKSRSSLICTLAQEVIIDYLFDNRWK